MTTTTYPVPPLCWTFVESEGLVAMIERGQSGYNPVGGKDDREDNLALVAEQNAILGVKPSEVEAMIFGSMFGWDLPGADPLKYADLDFFAELETVSPELAEHARQKHREGLRGDALRTHFKVAFAEAEGHA